MNILVTLDENYIPQLIIMMKSILNSTPNTNFKIYIAHKSLTNDNFKQLNEGVDNPRCEFVSIVIEDAFLKDAPVTDRYPKEMYYRIFASKYLPSNLDRILYLDPDIVVINSLEKLYNMDFEGNYFIAASHVNKSLHRINEYRLDMDKDSAYINSGVMLMNLALLRKEQDLNEVFNYIERYKNRLLLPDQDVLSGLYGSKTKTVDSLVYNLSDRYLALYNLDPENWRQKIDLNWVRENTVIIHYCGRNKPWKDNYLGILDVFYKELL